MEEPSHIISVLQQTKSALKKEDAQKLKHLSNQHLHTATCNQDSESITTMIIIYALSKIIERKPSLERKNWEDFVRNFNSTLDLTIKSVKEKKPYLYQEKIKKLRSLIKTISPNINPYIKEIIKKSCLNKANKIYQHGISLEQTAKLLGVTQWELSGYTGSSNLYEAPKETAISTQKRIKIAVDFFS
jgi:hypothetical protein